MAEHVVGVHHQRARLRLRVARRLGDHGRQVREPAVHVEQAERVRAPVRRDVADHAARDVAAPGPLGEVGAVGLPARAGRLGGARAAAAARARAGAAGPVVPAVPVVPLVPVVPPLPAVPVVPPLPAVPVVPRRCRPRAAPGRSAAAVPGDPAPARTGARGAGRSRAAVAGAPPAPAAAPAVPVLVPPEPSPPVPVPVGPPPSLVAHEDAASRTTAAAISPSEDGVPESRPMPDQ